MNSRCAATSAENAGADATTWDEKADQAYLWRGGASSQPTCERVTVSHSPALYRLL